MYPSYLPRAVLLTTLGCGLLHLPAQADVVPNGLGSAVDDTVCTPTCNITGGTVPTGGNNLYHSFQEFSIPATGTATLQHAAAIENIFLRVTDVRSEINGGLATNNGTGVGTASIFLLNPHGVIFGPNASLNIGGSFIVSTAESIRFQDGTEFQVADTNPLLSISTPIGLQLGSGAGSIDVATAANPGPGNGLFLNPNFSINRGARPVGLAVADRQTLALVGQGISMTGSNLTAPNGRIELGSVSGPAFVTLIEPTAVAPGWQLAYDSVSTFGDITLSSAASVDVSDATSGSSGDIQVRGQSLTMSGGSAIISETLGAGTGGDITIGVNNINLSGISANVPALPSVPIQTGIFADVGDGQSGTGGDIAVNTQNLTITDGAQITVLTFGSGDGGDLIVNAETIDLVGGSDFGPSAFFAAVGRNAAGNGGQLTVNTNSLSLQDGAQIVSSSFGTGNAGSITVNADAIAISGGSTDGPSSLQSASERPLTGSGNANNVTVNTRTISLTDGGQISTATAGPGNAGNILINASESVAISGGSTLGRSGLFSTAVKLIGPPFLLGTGNGGNITVNTAELDIRDAATISVSNFPSTASTTREAGTGRAGSISISARTAILADGSRLNAESNHSSTADGGANINVTAEALVLRRESQINANALGTATGGNITLNTTALIALENSDITANAVDNFGGRVVVNAQTILGTAFREALTPESDITASSALGPQFSGTVDINSPQIDPSQGVDGLEDAPAANDQVSAACQPGGGNTFVASGHGGLPEDASQLLRGNSVWRDLRLAEAPAQHPSQAGASQAGISNTAAVGSIQPIEGTLVEAQDVFIDAQGQVSLLPAPSSQIALQDHPQCLAS